jgi:gold/copper resistance efflux system membrane fusion protein
MSRRTGILGAVTAASLVAGGLFLSFDGGQQQAVAQQQPAAAQPPPVEVVETITRSLPETASYTGRLAAIEHVELRPRIGGYIAAVKFREGSLVERGQILFQIDARTFQATAARANAQLLQAQARHTLAATKAVRARRLRADDVISQAELDTATADEAETLASVEAARAYVGATAIDVSDTVIRSPIDGRIGEANATLGNLVNGATLLTTIVSIDPLHVELAIDESTFRRITKADREAKAKVQVFLGDETIGHEATLDFITNQIDPTTGTARVRAVLANKDGQLTPGMFTRVRIETGAPRDAILIRDEAIGTSAQGRHVLVVKPDGMVELRRVELGESIDGLRVIRSGLSAGERVILKGMARPGMKVTPKLVAEGGVS